MPTSLDQYRAAKADYLKLRNQAKKELIARFNELANELLSIQRELAEDFGEKVTMPTKPKKRPAATASAAPAPTANDQRVAAVQKKIDGQKKKLADLQAAGKPTKAVEDRIYELEDELRLAKEG
jgi:chromosome segregation ATPase